MKASISHQAQEADIILGLEDDKISAPQPDKSLAGRASVERDFEDKVKEALDKGLSEERVAVIGAIRGIFSSAAESLEALHFAKDRFILAQQPETLQKTYQECGRIIQDINSHVREAHVMLMSQGQALTEEERESFKEPFADLIKLTDAEVEAINDKIAALEATEAPARPAAKARRASAKQKADRETPESQVPAEELERYEMRSGFVSKFYESRGFGFADMDGESVFLHFKEGVMPVERNGRIDFPFHRDKEAPVRGTEVVMTVIDTERGLKAKAWCTAAEFLHPAKPSK